MEVGVVKPCGVYLLHKMVGAVEVFVHEERLFFGVACGGDDYGVFRADYGAMGVFGGGYDTLTSGEGGKGGSLHASYHCPGCYASGNVGIVRSFHDVFLLNGVVDVALAYTACDYLVETVFVAFDHHYPCLRIDTDEVGGIGLLVGCHTIGAASVFALENLYGALFFFLHALQFLFLFAARLFALSPKFSVLVVGEQEKGEKNEEDDDFHVDECGGSDVEYPYCHKTYAASEECGGGNG